MRRVPFVTVATLAAFLVTSTVSPAFAGQSPVQPISSGTPIRASIDRAVERAQQAPTVPVRSRKDVRKQMTGGGGGGGMMVMTLIVTAASLAGTYFLMKELKKTTDEATRNAQ
jgi:hypothetical protein